MRRFRKNQNQPSVSLFPFLAVLICTLGVLIVMLVLAVKSAEVAKEENQATQDQAAAEKIEEAKQRLALEQFRSESIHDIRADVLARLATSRGNRSYLQQDVSDATKELDATSKQLQALKKSLANANKTNPVLSDQSEVQAKKAAIAKLTQQIVAAKQALADQQKKSKQQGPSRFSLVPFRGSGGTFRRPIFLECLKNEVRLQPLGITLSKQDFALPIRAGNPLDVALLTIQEHWQQLDVAGEQGSPYPLLVVRPGGAETFVLARRAMKSWADEFGYELVDAEKGFGLWNPRRRARFESRQRHPAVYPATNATSPADVRTRTTPVKVCFQSSRPWIFRLKTRWRCGHHQRLPILRRRSQCVTRRI